MLRAADGSRPLVYGKHKVRQWPLDYGSGSIHRSAPMPDTIELTRRLQDRAGLVGHASVEFKRHAGTGELVLIEAKRDFPRASAWGTPVAWTHLGASTRPSPASRSARSLPSATGSQHLCSDSRCGRHGRDCVAVT